LLAKINREAEIARAGGEGRIRFKLNSLLDEEFIDALYRASNAGVRIDITVRGICALRAGLVGRSENITVRSILGRYLEHSRIYHFANAGHDEYWIGSADLMHRNLDRRIEALVQVTEPEHQNHLDFLLRMYEDRNISQWQMASDGSWNRITQSLNGEDSIDLHSELIAHSKSK
jgi:polyphosphate kinase